MNHQQKQLFIDRFLQENRNAGDMDIHELVRAVTVRFATDYPHMELIERRRSVRNIIDTMRGLDILQPLTEDDSITEIMVNGPYDIYLERNGKLEKSDVKFDDRRHLTHVITRYFGRANRLINEQKPIAGMRLEDGSRIHAILPPAAPDGPIINIRRFTGVRPSLDELVRLGSLDRDTADFLIKQIKARKNIFISGGTGSGKTTLLNALSGHIDTNERIVTIEDALELDLQGIDNLVRLETRKAGPDGTGGIDAADLIRSSLRLRPDRIIVGEIRGAEAFEMIQAMSTGHPGSMSTGHGNNSYEMLDRISLMILMSSNLPWEAIRRLVANALDYIVHLERRGDGSRHVSEVMRVDGYSDAGYRLIPFRSSAEEEA